MVGTLLHNTLACHLIVTIGQGQELPFYINALLVIRKSAQSGCPRLTFLSFDWHCTLPADRWACYLIHICRLGEDLT